MSTIITRAGKGSPLTNTEVDANFNNLNNTKQASFGSQTANYVYAAPNGAAGVPSFRLLVAVDVPTLNQNTTGTASNVTGTVAIANGGTSSTTPTTARSALGLGSIATQAASAVAITGGAVDGTTVGSTTAAAGAFTTLAASGVATLTAGAVIQGLTVGRGAGSIASNTAIGTSALSTNTTGANNTAIGNSTASGITTGSGNTVLGANVSGLSATLTNNVIIADGTGAIKAQHNGTYWAFTGPIRAAGYTVATLPTGVQGMRAFVTDSLAPAYLAMVVGGGAIVAPVFYNGSQWVTA